jgi:hypothetical protein
VQTEEDELDGDLNCTCSDAVDPRRIWSPVAATATSRLKDSLWLTLREYVRKLARRDISMSISLSTKARFRSLSGRGR